MASRSLKDYKLRDIAHDKIVFSQASEHFVAIPIGIKRQQQEKIIQRKTIQFHILFFMNVVVYYGLFSSVLFFIFMCVH